MAGRGYSVRVLPGLDPRKLIDPALMADLAQLMPESTGPPLARAVTGRGLIRGRPAAAQGGNAIVVTAATAARYRPGTISSFGTSAADRILDRLTEPPRGKPGTSTAFPSSPAVRSRSSTCSPAPCPTKPSPPGCTYPTRPCATTSATSWPRPAHPTGTPPPTSPAGRAWAASPAHKHLATNRVRRDAPPLRCSAALIPAPSRPGPENRSDQRDHARLGLVTRFLPAPYRRGPLQGLDLRFLIDRERATRVSPVPPDDVRVSAAVSVGRRSGSTGGAACWAAAGPARPGPPGQPTTASEP